MITRFIQFPSMLFFPFLLFILDYESCILKYGKHHLQWELNDVIPFPLSMVQLVVSLLILVKYKKSLGGRLFSEQ